MMQGNHPYDVRHKTIFVWNIAVGSACFLLVTISLGVFVWGVLDTVRHHKELVRWPCKPS